MYWLGRYFEKNVFKEKFPIKKTRCNIVVSETLIKTE